MLLRAKTVLIPA